MTIKAQIFKKLFESNQRADAYLEKIPTDIATAFFDNAFVNEKDYQIQELEKAVFGDATWVINWFLYEWTPGSEVELTHENGVKVTKAINDIDDYIDWLRNVEGRDF